MTTPPSPTLNILSTFLSVSKNCRADAIENGPDFWRGLMAGSLAGADDGCFVFGRSFEADSRIWERHPQGDEVIVLLDGAADLVLDQEGGLHTIELRAVGDFVRVPEGVWHKFVVMRNNQGQTTVVGAPFDFAQGAEPAVG